MYPFFVLGIEENASDEEVEAAYLTLIRQYPPDREPERFRLVREAYEAVNTAARRQQTRLFYVDQTGRALTESFPLWAQGNRPQRLSTAALAQRLREVAP